jgi:hypothetical protein
VTTTFAQTYIRRHIALPSEHGAWVFILSPLLVGLFAGGRWTPASAYLIIGAMTVFLMRQPLTIAVKAYSGRRSRGDLPAARFWIAIYGLLGILFAAGLILNGFGYLLYLALPGVPVFIWHLYLVSRRAERRKAGIEVVASGVLALAAPAAFWVGVGYPDPAGWWLFALCWMQSAASIVYAYLRLEQRNLPVVPDPATRLRLGRWALLYSSFNPAAVFVLSRLQFVPSLAFVPFLLQWAETLWGIYNPAVGVKPVRIGIRQLIVSTLFTMIFIVTWNVKY